MSVLKKFAGQTAIYGLTTVLARLFNFILTPIFTGVFSPAKYGVISLMYSYVAFLNALLSFGMETSFFRYLNKYENDKEKVYSNTFLTICFIASIFLLFTLLFTDGIAAWIQQGDVYDPDYARYVKYFVAILILDALVVIPFAKLRADGKPLRFSMVKLINIFTFVGLNLIFIYVIPKIIEESWAGAEFFKSWYRYEWVGYIFISNLAASAITLLLLLPEIFQIKIKFDSRLSKEMLFYSFPIFIANISFIINENLDKIFLSHLLPDDIAEQELGIYFAVCRIAVFLSIFINAFRLGAEPFFFSHSKNKNSGETYARIMNYFIIAVCLIFVLLTANIELVKYFIRGDTPQEIAQYWSGLKIVPVLLFGYVSLGIYINLSIWYKLSDQTRYGLYISGIGAFLTILLNLIFIPHYGYVASAWISLTVYTTMMLLSYFWGQKNYPIPYNLKKGIAYLLGSVCIVFISFVVFERNLIAGNVLFIIFTFVCYLIEKDDLKKVFSGNDH